MDGAPGTVKLVQPDQRGLRFTIPNGLGEGPAVATKFGIRGDFEITATFEVLSNCARTSAMGWARTWSSSRRERGTSSRRSLASARPTTRSSRWSTRRRSERRRSGTPRLHPTQATSGRLRLVRVGPTLHYQLAEGDAKIFHEMFVSEYGAEDLEFVRLSATTGGSKKAVDLLWKDLSVRAEELPGWVGPDRNRDAVRPGSRRSSSRRPCCSD